MDKIRITQSVRGQDFANLLQRMDGAQCLFSAEIDKEGSVKNLTIRVADGEDEITVKAPYSVLDVAHTKVPSCKGYEVRVVEGSVLEKKLSKLHVPTRAMFLAPQTRKDAEGFAVTLCENVGETDVASNIRLFEIETRKLAGGQVQIIEEKAIELNCLDDDGKVRPVDDNGLPF